MLTAHIGLATLIVLVPLAASAEDWQLGTSTYGDAPVTRQARGNDGAQRARQDGPYLRPMDAPDGPGNSYGAKAYDNGPSPHSPSGESDRGNHGGYQPDSGPNSQNAVMQDAMPPAVESGAMAPVMSSDGSGLPFELWKGLDAAALEKLVATIEIPPRSPALHQLWTKLITSSVDTGGRTSADFTALRLEMLYRSGLARAAAEEFAKQPVSDNALLLTLEARNELASNNAEKACQLVKRASTLKSSVPARLKGQTILMAGYCSATQNDNAGAGLAAELARDEGVETSPGLEALDAISIKAKPRFSAVKQVTLLDYRIAEKAGGLAHKVVLEKGEPALLAALATDASTPVDLGLPATEAAARLNAISPETLAGIYRVNAGSARLDEPSAGGGQKGVFRRAALFKAAESEKSPMRKARLIRSFLDDAKADDLLMIADRMIAPASAQIRPAQEVEWFAETAIEIALAAGDYDMARKWIAVGDQSRGPADGLDHWRALVDIADPKEPNRGQSLQALEGFAGRFAPPVLYRFTTVLEALDYLVPIPLWEAANRAPQPNTGYLPETGVLSELQAVSKKQEFGHTVLLVMKALGPNGAQDANLIALGDSIRALKRAGLEADARRLGLEALLGLWPRTATN